LSEIQLSLPMDGSRRVDAASETGDFGLVLPDLAGFLFYLSAHERFSV
jgi:hypothetical protein